MRNLLNAQELIEKSSQLLVSGILWLINVPRNEPVLGGIKSCLIASSKFVPVFSSSRPTLSPGFSRFSICHSHIWKREDPGDPGDEVHLRPYSSSPRRFCRAWPQFVLDFLLLFNKVFCNVTIYCFLFVSRDDVEIILYIVLRFRRNFP